MEGESRFLEGFLQDAGDDIETIERCLNLLDNSPGDFRHLDSIFRSVHTLKGNASFFSLKGMTAVAHGLEDLLGSALEGPGRADPTLVKNLREGMELISGIVRSASSGEVPREMTVRERLFLAGLSSGGPPPCGEAGGGYRAGDLVRYYAAGADVTRPVFILEDCMEKFRAGRTSGDGKFCGALSRIEAAFREGGMFPQADSAGRIILEFQEIVDDSGIPGEFLLDMMGTELSALFESIEKKPAAAGGEAAAPPPQEPPGVLRTKEEKIDEILGAVRKLDELRGEFGRIRDGMGRGSPDPGFVLRFQKALNTYSGLSRDILQMLINIKVASPRLMLEKVEELAGSLAKTCSKKIRIETSGEEVFIDRTKMRMIETALIHIVRNCVDHGIEPPEERISKGKPEEGLIKISVSGSSAGHSVVVSDDGRGIDSDAVREAAIRDNRINPGDSRAGEECFSLAFLPGISTSGAVTEISGRGMGMSAAREAVLKAGGSVKVNSMPDAGTTVELSFPGSV